MKTDKITWIVDELLEETKYDCGFPSLGDAAQELGHNVIRAKYIGFDTIVDPEFKTPLKKIEELTNNDCVVMHGSIQFCNEMIRRYGKKFIPLAYYSEGVKSYHKFAVHLGDNLLNDDYYIIPFKTFSERPIDKPVFIKPLSGLKEFTGKVIKPYDFDHEISSMQQIERVNDDSLCVVASPKNILSEFRYLIVDRKVVDGSEYRWDNVLDVRIDTLPECDKMAEWMANLEWQPDTVYICDVAMTDVGPKIIELNAFSSSGLYALNTYKVVEEVSKAALREFYGDW